MKSDTDSNFLALYNQTRLIQDSLNLDYDDEEIVFKIISTLAYLLSNVIREAYALYTENCNVPDEKRHIINMKNEYLWKRLVLTTNKKNYASKRKMDALNFINCWKLFLQSAVYFY